MSENKPVHINRTLTDEERARHAAIREAALRDYYV